jgi:hypothetical protein
VDDADADVLFNAWHKRHCHFHTDQHLEQTLAKIGRNVVDHLRDAKGTPAGHALLQVCEHNIKENDFREAVPFYSKAVVSAAAHPPSTKAPPAPSPAFSASN